MKKILDETGWPINPEFLYFKVFWDEGETEWAPVRRAIDGPVVMARDPKRSDQQVRHWASEYKARYMVRGFYNDLLDNRGLTKDENGRAVYPKAKGIAVAWGWNITDGYHDEYLGRVGYHSTGNTL